jgi:hypothetical protein
MELSIVIFSTVCALVLLFHRIKLMNQIASRLFMELHKMINRMES